MNGLCHFQHFRPADKMLWKSSIGGRRILAIILWAAKSEEKREQARLRKESHVSYQKKVTESDRSHVRHQPDSLQDMQWHSYKPVSASCLL